MGFTQLGGSADCCRGTRIKAQRSEDQFKSADSVLDEVCFLEIEDPNGGYCSDSSISAAEHYDADVPGSRKSVTFANIEVRRYSLVVGDHPCCTVGCPLSLGWEYSEATKELVEDFEASRGPRRTRDQLKTSGDQRRKLLAEHTSEIEIRRASRKLHRVRSCTKIAEKASESFFAQLQPLSLQKGNVMF